MPKIQLSDIHVQLGETSLTPQLGCYYLDFTAVLPLVKEEFHGPVDEKGVPLNRFGAQGNFYNVITIAQYALALHDTIRKTGATSALDQLLQAQLDAIVEHVEREGEWAGFFLHRWNNPKYPALRAPWVSSLSQGNCLSALLRGYQWNGDERLLDLARSMFRALERPLDKGGTRLIDENGHLWFEEYPMQPPSHVLNGFIFTLWGVLDYARATGDSQAWEWWNAGVETLRAHIADYDCGFWSVYDLSHRELANEHYQDNIHVPQLEAMHSLTDEEIFARYAQRWRGFSQSAWRRRLWWFMLRWDARVKRWGGSARAKKRQLKNIESL